MSLIPGTLDWYIYQGTATLRAKAESAQKTHAFENWAAEMQSRRRRWHSVVDMSNQIEPGLGESSIVSAAYHAAKLKDIRNGLWDTHTSDTHK